MNLFVAAVYRYPAIAVLAVVVTMALLLYIVGAAIVRQVERDERSLGGDEPEELPL